MPKKTVRRRKGDRWCEIEVELQLVQEKPHRLSIVGSEGSVMCRPDAEEAAIEYWRSFFDESPEELGSMLKRFPHEMADRLAEYKEPDVAAAHLVVDLDGALHGMDVHIEDGDDIYTCQSCGQIRDELRDWFPEVVPWLKWHLNDMNAGCEHQDELGWGRKRDIALARADCTQVQLDVLDLALAEEVRQRRVKFLNAYLVRMEASTRAAWLNGKISSMLVTDLKAAGLKPSQMHVEMLVALRKAWSIETLEAAYLDIKRVLLPLAGQGYTYKKARSFLKVFIQGLWNLAKLEIGDQQFKSQIWSGSLGAPCPVCGYRYGTAWLHRELPAEVMPWFESIDSWPSGEMPED